MQQSQADERSQPEQQAPSLTRTIVSGLGEQVRLRAEGLAEGVAEYARKRGLRIRLSRGYFSYLLFDGFWRTHSLEVRESALHCEGVTWSGAANITRQLNLLVMPLEHIVTMGLEVRRPHFKDLLRGIGAALTAVLPASVLYIGYDSYEADDAVLGQAASIVHEWIVSTGADVSVEDFSTVFVWVLGALVVFLALWCLNRIAVALQSILRFLFGSKHALVMITAGSEFVVEHPFYSGHTVRTFVDRLTKYLHELRNE